VFRHGIIVKDSPPASKNISFPLMAISSKVSKTIVHKGGANY
jgi:hypothetical protein